MPMVRPLSLVDSIVDPIPIVVEPMHMVGPIAMVEPIPTVELTPMVVPYTHCVLRQ